MKEKEYETEAEFLKHYDPNVYERPSVTADILIFSIANGIQENYRKLNEKHFSVLLVKKQEHPFKGKWCLPGGFVGIEETIDDAAKRILKKETNLEDIYIEQLYTFGDVNRDPRTRVISTSYMALVDKNMLSGHIASNASWFRISYTQTTEDYHVTLDNGEETLSFVVEKKLREKTTDRYEYMMKENNDLAFDHPLMIVSGIERLKNKAEYTDIVFNMMPKYFTLGDLQGVYEIILNKPLLKPAFRRIIANKVEKTDQLKTGDGHRPSVLFQYKKSER